MTRQRSAIEAALSKKGFHELTGGDHRRFVYYDGGKATTVRTKTSHGSGYQTIGDSLLGQMARQVGLTKGDFLQLVDCPLSAEAYRKKLVEKNILPAEDSGSPPRPATRGPQATGASS